MTPPTNPQPSPLSSPFARLSTSRALLLSVIGVGSMGLISYYTHTHNDGVIDIHYGTPSLLRSWLTPIAVWLLLSFTVWLVAVVLRRDRVRFVDALAYTGVSRLPLLAPIVVGAFTVDGGSAALLLMGKFSVGVVLYLLFSILAVVASVYLLWYAFVLCANRTGKQAALLFILVLLLSSSVVYLERFYSGSREEQPAPTAKEQPREVPEAHAQQLERVASLIREGNAEELHVLFDDSMSEQLPLSHLTAVLDEVRKRFGTITEIGSPSPVADKGPYAVYTLPVTFEHGALTLSVTLNGEGQVSGLFLR